MKKILFVLALTLAVVATPKAAKADLILGQHVVYTGGVVRLRVLEASAAYHSYLALYNADGTRVSRFFAENHETGETARFNPANFGYQIGDELIFGIRVYSSGYSYLNTYLMGEASRNPDDHVHAGVMERENGSIVVGFEDIYNGGDHDYNDSRFVFRSGVRVPEPGVLLLMGLGLLGIGARRFGKSAA